MSHVLPDLAALPRPIAVVAHDAGAANLLFGWLEGIDPAIVRVHVAGPAAAIWRTRFPDIPVVDLDTALAGAGTLLSGTGWASDLEHEARRRARAAGIPAIAAIDHWVNYRQRFVRDGVECLPDRIWVGDSYALDAARAQLPEVPAEAWTNMYVARTVARIAALDAQSGERSGDRVLYALEPIRLPWGGEDPRPGEFQALDYFMANRDRLGIATDAPVRLRPHPSDPPGKYDDWLAAQAGSDVALARDEPIEDAVSWASWIAGCESFVVLLAIPAGRRVVSTLPPWGNPLRLPQPEIVRLAAL